MTDNIAGVTDEAVQDATGRDWETWFDLLDGTGAAEKSHAEIVETVREAGLESGWWQQKIAVGYEQERDLREAGETADAGFQFGVQRTLPVPREALWERLLSPEGREVWLGEGVDLSLEPGATYETSDGTRGKVRTVADGERVRLTWQPPAYDDPTTLQVTIAGHPTDGERSVLRFHQEELPDGAQREELRAHWRSVADEIEALVDPAGD